MDEGIINGAAIVAISDLELDCEIKEVCQTSGKDEWCIRFSGKYGQFCDAFKNQFDEENSPAVVREKIKAHLLKQVTKIRSTTGRRRIARVESEEDSRAQASDLIGAPIKLVGEMFGRASGIAGEIVNRASAVAETARAAVSAMSTDTGPVTPRPVPVTTPEAEEKKASPARKSVKAGKKSSSKKTGKARKRVSSRIKRVAKKASKAATKKASKSALKKARARKTGGRKKTKKT